MVIIDQPRLPDVPLVGIDERASARACAEHLRGLGHKRFAIVTSSLGADKYCGYIDRNRVKKSCYELNRVRVSTYLDVLDKGGQTFPSRFGNGTDPMRKVAGSQAKTF